MARLHEGGDEVGGGGGSHAPTVTRRYGGPLFVPLVVPWHGQRAQVPRVG